MSWSKKKKMSKKAIALISLFTPDVSSNRALKGNLL
jgi:hypothetical protein